MSQTLISVCDARNCLRCSSTERRARHTPAQLTELPDSATLLNALRDTAKPMRNRSQADGCSGEVRASYAIESERLESMLWLVVLAALGAGCALGVGLCRVFVGSR